MGLLDAHGFKVCEPYVFTLFRERERERATYFDVNKGCGLGQKEIMLILKP